jgi:GSH-dependent disulfide-bond oxidoreductase
MLELHHWEPNGASARVMISLEEKELDYTSHYVDVLAFAQHRPEFLELNETGQVPVLMHDGAPYTEASYICELLEEAFPERPLMPRQPRGRWEVRVWQKYVDDGFAASVSELAWSAYGAGGLSALSPAELSAALERIPTRERRDLWTTSVAGLREEQLALARGRIKAAVEKIESRLEGAPWLAGSEYSLADIAVFSYFKYLPALFSGGVSDAAAPRAMSWMRAVAARPAVRAALARGRASDPFAIAAPGPEQIRWG